MSMNAWPMDPTSIMQQPAILNKLYTDHIASVQQQQYIQQAQMAMLQALQNNAVKQLNESPKITPPSSNPPMPQITPSTVSINSNIDPLASLHNMVHRQPKTNSAPIIASKTPAPVIKKEEPKAEKTEEPIKNEEDEIIDVGTPPEQPQMVQQAQETALRITPPLSAPPKMNGPSFSIAEILHSSSQGQLEELQQRALTPLSIPMQISQNDTATSSRSSTDTLMESQSIPESHSSRHSPSCPKQDSNGQNAKQRMAQRKKHVEFHRRMKAMASRGKFSQCQLCGETVRNNCSDLTNHVYTHSKTPLFGCVKCEAGFRQKVDLHTHCKDKHPNELAEIQDQQIDLRDMAKLCGILENCFPRNSKLVIETLLKKLLKSCKGSDALRCKQCDKDVPSNVTSLKNHLNQHPRYRCKMCHFTNENECEQLKHGQEQHGNESPLYNVTSAAIVLSGTLTSCFGDYMPADQQEFCEEMASLTDPSSPQGSPQLQAPKSN
ncbi:hypothetical protein M3Y97_00514800 [Aphelenchoides bicaudatus]|nr:hypothetical protein M3Y97_00514800 [Aphelenchoides bicaudatus]